MGLSDHIESFIIELLEETDQIELQRNELAQHFSCVPSQINYVLATRFNIDRGYIIQSRRGGGGYIRVLRVDTSNEENSYILHLLNERIGGSISYSCCEDILQRLRENGFVTAKEASLMLAALQDGALSKAEKKRSALRADVLRAMLKAIIQA